MKTKTAIAIVSLCIGAALGSAFVLGMKFGEHQTKKWLWRPDPTGYVACDVDGSAIAGNIKIIDGFTEEEFKDAMIRLCQHKLRWRPI